ncbi:diguanylate cyclase regulator RdcB family protein [Escherichia coli]
MYEWFSARCRWKEKALTQRGLLVQAGDQSEQIFTRWRAGRLTPRRAWALFYRSGGVALGGIWRCLPSGKPASGGVVAG